MIFSLKNTGCQDKLGMENGEIPNANIKGSRIRTFDGMTYDAHLARLNSVTYTWLVESSKGSMPWIQADIGYQTCVTGLITQGNGTPKYPDWITKLTVSTFSGTTDDSAEIFIDENGVPKVSIDVESVCLTTVD